MSVSSQVIFDRKAKSLPVKKTRVSLQPSGGNSTFSALEQIEFNIPASRMGQFLNSQNTVLRYKITTPNNTNDHYLDHNGSCVIQRIEVYNGSQLLENINNYNVLYSIMMDMQYDIGIYQNALTITHGTNNTQFLGALMNNKTAEIAMPLLSSVCGMLSSDKMLPLYKLSNGIRVVLTLASDNTALVQPAVATTFTVSEVYLDAEVVELSSEAIQVVEMANKSIGSDIQIPVRQFQNFIYTLPSGTSGNSEYVSQIDARFSSCNGIIFCPRNATSSATGYSVTSRVNPYSKFQVRIGNSYYPPKPLEKFNEFFTESQKYMHSLNSLDNFGSVNATVYSTNDSATVDYVNKFFLALDLESYPNKSELLYDGVSTINDSIYILGTTQSDDLVNTIQVDCFVNFDCILSIDEYGMMSRSM
jgi:hypothetical protein